MPESLKTVLAVEIWSGSSVSKTQPFESQLKLVNWHSILLAESVQVLLTDKSSVLVLLAPFASLVFKSKTKPAVSGLTVIEDLTIFTVNSLLALPQLIVYVQVPILDSLISQYCKPAPTLTVFGASPAFVNVTGIFVELPG